MARSDDQRARQQLLDRLREQLIFGGAQEAELYPLIAEGNEDSEVFRVAIWLLGDALGDNDRAAAVLRDTYANNRGDQIVEENCLKALVKRISKAAIPDLREAWLHVAHRDPRGVALEGLGYLGITDYFPQVLPLCKRVLIKDQRYSGGVAGLNLINYVISCSLVRREQCLEFTELLRSNWEQLKPEPYMQARFEKIFPGIGDSSMDLSEVKGSPEPGSGDTFRRPEDRELKPGPRKPLGSA